MEIEVDWDLHAVVRGCSTHASSADRPLSTYHQTDELLSSDDLGFGNNSLHPLLQFHEPQPQHQEELYDLFRPFIVPASSPHPFQPSTSTAPRKSQQQLQDEHDLVDVAGVSNCRNIQVAGSRISSGIHHRSKRIKKKQLLKKKVCQVPADGLPSSDDKWSWRKYGQKPIKGSPYPRGYYRCSSSKGCPARKQVERNRSDPNMFIVTYAAEHNHPAPTHRNSHHHHQKLSSKPATSTSSSPTTPSYDDDDIEDGDVQYESTKTEHREEEEERRGKNDMDAGLFLSSLDDDFFDGLDEIVGDGSANVSVR